MLGRTAAVLGAASVVLLGPCVVHAQDAPENAEYFGFAVSGGVSLGAYEAGAMWTYLRLLRREREHSYVLRGLAGASAGAITSFLGALAWCAEDAPDGWVAGTDPYDNVLAQSWLEVGLDDLVPAYGRPEEATAACLDGIPSTMPDSDAYRYCRDDAVLTRLAFKRVFEKLATKIESTRFRPGCKLPFAVPVTRETPGEVTIGDLSVPTQRFILPLRIEICADGTPRFYNDEFSQRRPGLLGSWLYLPGKPKDRCPRAEAPLSATRARPPIITLELADVIRAVLASSAFPLAFSPVTLMTCERAKADPDAAIRTPEEVFCPSAPDGVPLALREDRFIDGGVFDNVPLGVLEAQMVTNGPQVRHDHLRSAKLIYFDPDSLRTWPTHHTSERVGFQSILDTFGGALTTARRYELAAVARFGSAHQTVDLTLLHLAELLPANTARPTDADAALALELYANDVHVLARSVAEAHGVDFPCDSTVSDHTIDLGALAGCIEVIAGRLKLSDGGEGLDPSEVWLLEDFVHAIYRALIESPNRALRERARALWQQWLEMVPTSPPESDSPRELIDLLEAIAARESSHRPILVASERRRLGCVKGSEAELRKCAAERLRAEARALAAGDPSASVATSSVSRQAQGLALQIGDEQALGNRGFELDSVGIIGNRLFVARRFPILMASQVGNFGAFLHRRFREYDYAAGIYDALVNVAQMETDRGLAGHERTEHLMRSLEHLGLDAATKRLLFLHASSELPLIDTTKGPPLIEHAAILEDLRTLTGPNEDFVMSAKPAALEKIFWVVNCPESTLEPGSTCTLSDAPVQGVEELVAHLQQLRFHDCDEAFEDERSFCGIATGWSSPWWLPVAQSATSRLEYLELRADSEGPQPSDWKKWFNRARHVFHRPPLRRGTYFWNPSAYLRVGGPSAAKALVPYSVGVQIINDGFTGGYEARIGGWAAVQLDLGLRFRELDQFFTRAAIPLQVELGALRLGVGPAAQVAWSLQSNDTRGIDRGDAKAWLEVMAHLDVMSAVRLDVRVAPDFGSIGSDATFLPSRFELGVGLLDPIYLLLSFL